MQKWFFAFGIINIVLGLILAGYMIANAHVFETLEGADQAKIEVFFIPMAPIFTGIALMIAGWPKKGG